MYFNCVNKKIRLEKKKLKEMLEKAFDDGYYSVDKEESINKIMQDYDDVKPPKIIS